ncbi:MAG: hypothetical protein ABW082_15790 [Sedimenticola sp.]
MATQSVSPNSFTTGEVIHFRPVLLNEANTAKYIGRSTGWLRNQRVKDSKAIAEKRSPEGPPWVRLGRSIMYRLVALDAWLNANLEEMGQVDRSYLHGR